MAHRIPWITRHGHDPDALLDYAICLDDYLETVEVVSSVAWAAYTSDGETTTDAPFTIDPSTSAVPQAATVKGKERCEVVWLTVTGADAAAKVARHNEIGIITLTFATDQGRTDDMSFKLQVKKH